MIIDEMQDSFILEGTTFVKVSGHFSGSGEKFENEQMTSEKARAFEVSSPEIQF